MEQSTKDVKIPFLTVLFILVGLFLYTKLAGPIPLSVNSITTTKTDVFSVSGTGKATVVPDTAKVNFGITVNKSSVSDAQNEANRVINEITKQLKALGIDEKKIKTINYSVSPNYDFRPTTDGEGQRIRDYNVNATVEVEVTPIDKVNEAIDRATAAGANMVGNIQFTVEEKKRKELERQARKEAIEEAKQKAKELASDAGMNLGRIINIIESPGFDGPIFLEKAIPADGQRGGGVPTEIEPGETSITANVTLTYEVH